MINKIFSYLNHKDQEKIEDLILRNKEIKNN